MSTTENQMAVVVQKVVDSPLPPKVRHEARALLARLPADFLWVGQRVDEMAETFATDTGYEDPTSDLFKFVPVATVHRFMVEAAWRAVDVRAFVARAEDSADPAIFILGAIPARAVIFPRRNSWLVEPRDMTDFPALPSQKMRRRLEIDDSYEPPYVLFRLSMARMKAAGVQLRQPNALDAASARQPQWNPAGLAVGREYLDKAVPIEAVEEVVWKP